MSAILESYAYEDGCHLDYLGISKSEEFQRYVNLMQELQRVDISTLSDSERLAFFLNLHNAMLAFPKVNPLIHFGICNGSKSSPPVRFFTPHGVESEQRFAAREFLQRDRIQVDLAKRTVHLTRIFKCVDFGQEKQILKWIIGYLDATKVGLLSHHSIDGGAVHIVYQNYDWSINC
nr:glutaredoxin-related protein [Tanacetum cinerariifolium]